VQRAGAPDAFAERGHTTARTDEVACGAGSISVARRGCLNVMRSERWAQPACVSGALATGFTGSVCLAVSVGRAGCGRGGCGRRRVRAEDGRRQARLRPAARIEGYAMQVL
jgi:hypothetical protein